MTLTKHTQIFKWFGFVGRKTSNKGSMIWEPSVLQESVCIEVELFSLLYFWFTLGIFVCSIVSALWQTNLLKKSKHFLKGLYRHLQPYITAQMHICFKGIKPECLLCKWDFTRRPAHSSGTADDTNLHHHHRQAVWVTAPGTLGSYLLAHFPFALNTALWKGFTCALLTLFSLWIP